MTDRIVAMRLFYQIIFNRKNEKMRVVEHLVRNFYSRLGGNGASHTKPRAVVAPVEAVRPDGGIQAELPHDSISSESVTSYTTRLWKAEKIIF